MGASDGPKHPGKVLAWALQLGLSATVFIMEEKVTADTGHLYEGGEGCEGVRKIWKDARDEYLKSKEVKMPNAIFLQTAEKNIRRNYIIFILNSAVTYGNEEEKRKRRKEDRKYINILLDYLGALLRNIGAEHFKFSTPMKRTLDDGSIERYYPGNARIPEYTLNHTAPELDLMDMIRSHGIELVRQCLKFNVPRKDAQAYIDELIDRLLPYLEWVYTERRRGKGGFHKGGMRELRIVVKKIRTRYGTWNGRPQSVTGEIRETGGTEDAGTSISQETYDDQGPVQDILPEVDEPELPDIPSEEREGFETYWRDLLDRCPVDMYPKWQKHVTNVKEFTGVKDEKDQVIDEKKTLLTVRDTEHLYELLREESRRIGTAFHDFISNADVTHKPFYLSSVVRYLDTNLIRPSEFALVSEVSVANGRGRIDLILFRRKVILFADGKNPSSVWEPCMIIEIKTKSAFNLDLYAVPTRSKRDPKRRVVHFDHDRRRLTETEWEGIISSTPIKNTRDQLDAYKTSLLAEYARIARTDPEPPKSIAQAVLVVDSRENWDFVRDNLQNLVMNAYKEVKGEDLKGRKLFQLVDGERDVHASLIVLEGCENVETAEPVHVQRFDPFRHSQAREDTRKFTLYFPVTGKGSSQRSAAHIAADWHGIQYIYEQAKKSNQDVIWLDFSGEYTDLSLRKKRVHLSLYPRSLQRFVKWGVKFVDVSQDITDFLHHNVSLDIITDSVIGVTKSNSMIIVTGLDAVRGKTPSHTIPTLEEFTLHLIENIPEKTSVIWFDRPVPLSQTSQVYDTRCVAPFYQGSPWMYYVDEIIWNNPMSPPRHRSYIPADDDVRVVATERPGSLKTELITVPPLFKWGERFRADKDRDENIDSRTMYFLKGSYPAIGQQNLRRYDQDDINTTLELVPHLLDYSQKKKDSDLSIHRATLPTETSDPPPFMSMTSFTPYQTKTRKRTSKQKRRKREPRLEPLKKINHRRRYRRTLLKGTPPKMSTRPPHPGLLKNEPITESELVRKELNGLRATIRLLKSRCSKQWGELLSVLSGILDPREIRKKKCGELLNVLRQITTNLENHNNCEQIWKALKPFRLKAPQDLSGESYDAFRTLSLRYPGILILTGNQFFLILLAALEQNPQTRITTGLLETIWKYLLPWQLVPLGFTPFYHSQHRTGKSVLNRGRLLDTLSRKVGEIGEIIEKGGPSEVLFGQVIPVTLGKNRYPSALWLVFQSKVGSKEMNASLIPLPLVETSDVFEILQDLLRDRPYWGETDLTQLRDMAQKVDVTKGVPIMVTINHGVRGLWIYGGREWLHVGRFDFWTRKKEDVTLLQSFTLRKDPSLQSIKASQVRELPRGLEHDINQGLGIIRKSYRECQPARCNVSLDRESNMYTLEFSDAEKDLGELVVKRTSDVIELLRRPDFECEPVEVEGQKLVWNRFDDKSIKYDDDTALLRPWVERRNPFPTTELKLPKTADELARARRWPGLEIRITHEKVVCTKRSPSVDKKFKDEKTRDTYLKDIEGPPGQPDSLYFESTKGHGACWRVEPYYDDLPEGVTRLDSVMMKGHALGTLLKTGALVYQSGPDWIIHEFDAPDMATLPKEFKESYSIATTYRDIVSEVQEQQKRTGVRPPEVEDRWIVTVTWSFDHIVWSARSSATNQMYQGNTFTVPLYEKASLEHNRDLVMESILYSLPEEDIKDLDKLRKQVKNMLESHGFKTKMVCEARVTRRDDEIWLYLKKQGYSSEDVRISIEVEEGETVEDVWNSILEELEKGRFTGYSIKQEGRVKKQIKGEMEVIVEEYGWSPVADDKPVGPQWLNIFEYSAKRRAVLKVLDKGDLDKGYRQLEELLKSAEEIFEATDSGREFLLMLLLDRKDLLEKKRFKGTVSRALILQDLDRIYELSQGIEGWRLKTDRTPFWKRLHEALSLRKRLRS